MYKMNFEKNLYFKIQKQKLIVDVEKAFIFKLIFLIVIYDKFYIICIVKSQSIFEWYIYFLLIKKLIKLFIMDSFDSKSSIKLYNDKIHERQSRLSNSRNFIRDSLRSTTTQNSFTVDIQNP